MARQVITALFLLSTLIGLSACGIERRQERREDRREDRKDPPPSSLAPAPAPLRA